MATLQLDHLATAGSTLFQPAIIFFDQLAILQMLH
jgi:hypothetical protein